MAVGAEQTAALECGERAAVAVLADAVDGDVEPARQDAREIFALVVDRRGAELADQRRVRAARGAPQLEAQALLVLGRLAGTVRSATRSPS